MRSVEHVVVQYLGHSAWVWIGPAGTRVVIDPYHDIHPKWDWRWFLNPFPPVEADIVLVTHDHFDHNAVERIPGGPAVIRAAESVHRSEFVISGFEDRHASPDDMPNTIFVVEVCGVRFCHLGDNRADLPQDTVAAVGRVDVLFVPVDGSSHLLRFWEVNHLIEALSPRVVVPIHYLISGMTDPASTLLPPDEWLKTRPFVRRLETDTMHFNSDVLPAKQEVWVFEAR